MNVVKQLLCSCIIAAMLMFGAGDVYAVDANTDYTVRLQKVNTDGTLETVTTKTVTSDENGSLDYSFASVDSVENSNITFYVVTILDGDTVIRKGLVPAPANGNTTLSGINALSTKQTNAVLLGLESAETNDPIFAGIGMILLRAEGTSSSDVVAIAEGAVKAVRTGEGDLQSMVQFWTEEVGADKVDDFRSKLLSNSNKDFGDFSAAMKTAVDQTSTAERKAKLGIAGAIMGDIFIDAADAADIPGEIILAGFHVAGDIAENAFTDVSQSGMQNMDLAINSMITKIGVVNIERAYKSALTAMGADSSVINRFNTAINTLRSSMQTIEENYGDDIVDGDMSEQERDDMDEAYYTAHTTFESNIAATNGEIDALKLAIRTAFGMSVSSFNAMVGDDFATYYDYDPELDEATQRNWPLTRVVPMTWLANILSDGGTFTYTEDTITIPNTVVGWVGPRTHVDSEELADGNDADATLLAAFADFMNIQTDVFYNQEIAHYQHQEIDEDRLDSTHSDVETALVDRLFNLNTGRAGAISGTVDGSTAITSAQKKALIRLMMFPDINS